MTNKSCIKDHAPDRLIRIEEVKQLTSLSKSSINAWVAAGKFPKPTNLSLTIRVWRHSDVIAWIDEAIARHDR